MADKKAVILGAHGKIALLAAPRLVDAGYDVDGLIRNPDHAVDVRASGANPVELEPGGCERRRPREGLRRSRRRGVLRGSRRGQP